MGRNYNGGGLGWKGAKALSDIPLWTRDIDRYSGSGPEAGTRANG